MRAVIDAVLAIVAVLLLLAGLVALPVIIILAVIGGLTYLIFAVLHDRRIMREEDEDLETNHHE